MGKTAILAIKIVSDASRAPQGFDKTSTAAQRMERRVGSASRVAKVGLIGLVAAAGASAKAAAGDQKSQALLARAMRRSAGATKAQVAATETYISKTSAAKAVTDDELRPAMATLVRATGSAKKAQTDLSRALDISAATGKPLATVSAAIAKGYGGNTTALGRLVPGMDKSITKSKDMNKIMAELARTTGGSAATAANTAEGKMRRMSIAFGEAQESLGAVLIPVLTVLADKLMSVGTWLQNNTQAATIIIGVIAALAASVLIINTAFKVYSAYTKAAAAAQWLLNAAMSANPIALVVIAVIALVAGLVLAYKKSATFRSIVQAAGRGAAAALGWAVDKAKAVGTWLGKLGPAATKAKDVAVKAFKLYISPITLTIDAIKKLVGWIKNIKWPKPPKWLSKVGGALGKIGIGGPPKPPPGPGGGGFPGGRGGPSGGAWPWFPGPRGGGGGGVTIVIQGALDPVAVAKQIKGILRDSDVRDGKPA